MRTPIATVIAVAFVTVVTGASASAQVEPFVTGGIHRDVNRERFVGVAGGMLLSTKWLSVGAQGDAFVSPPYVAGRVTLLVQGNLFDVAGVRPFLQAGTSLGELKGSMYGAGVDLRRSGSGVGVRANVQTYLAKMWMGGRRAQPSVNLGVIWRL